MTQSAVEFRNSRGQRLVGVLHGELDSRAVISCHGMFSNKDGIKHTALGELLEKENLPLLRFDFAGFGGSEGSLFEMTYSQRVDDLEAAINHLASRGVTRFGLFGSSMGGAVALLTAARDERVVAIATLAAVGHPESLEERNPDEVRLWTRQGYIDTPSGRLSRSFMDDALEHDVIAAVRVLHAPLLVLHGVDDPTVPASDAHDIASAARHASLELVEGAGHEFTRPTILRPTLRQLAEFFARHLG
jgi:uncharacterized protein